MSAFAAILQKPGRPHGRTDMEAMLDAMARRGPHGRTIGGFEGAWLGHGLLATAYDGLAADEHAGVTLDGRLDNRDELAAALGLSPDPDDAALLLAAHRRWGPDCVDRIEGDFAFALWDVRSRQLLVARDRLGVRPVYYHETPDALLVASHPAALFALAPQLAGAIDDRVAAAYAAGEAHPADRTIHPGLARLPAAHVLVATSEATRVRRYFSWNVGTRAPGDAPPEYFATLLTLATQRRLAGPGRVGAMLSGGLDSSSIVTVASKLLADAGAAPLRIYSQIFPDDPAGDERPFIEAVVASSRVDPVYQSLDRVSPFADFDTLLAAQQLPFIGPNLATTRQTHSAAAGDGIRVLLDGHGGDEAVSSGVAWLYDLAYRGRIARLWRTLRPLARAERQSARRLFLHILKDKGPWRKAPGPRVRPAWLAEEAAAALVPAHSARPGQEARDEHLDGITGPFFALALETLNHAAAAEGIELRFPLLDRALLEWCLAAPGEDKLAEGHTRYLLRRGMAGLLPDKVRWRRDKHDFTGHLLRGMTGPDAAIVDRALEDRSGQLQRYFVLPELRRMWQAAQADPRALRGTEVQALWRAVALARWLERDAT